MKYLLLLALLTAGVYSADTWTKFVRVDENGVEIPVTGEEEASNFGGVAFGGNGGGAFIQDCQPHGGLKEIEMECGTYAGSIKLICNKKTFTASGLGLGSGDGSTFKKNVEGVTEIDINTAAYVNHVHFIRGGVDIFRCGKSEGGLRYAAFAPAGQVLCGLKGRAGHWIDKLEAGWCKVPPPDKPGCWVYTPSGCPNQKGYTHFGWRADPWGEMHRNAKYDRNKCLVTRKQEFNSWCGSNNTQMYWIKTPLPAFPTTEGCYVFTPSGCPKQKSFNAKGWVRDHWGEKYRNAAAKQSQCEVTRRNEYNSWCGTQDTQMYFVGLNNPTKPGCWVLTPSGCPKQGYNAYHWTPDPWGERHRNARYDQNACLVTRKKEFNAWCGANDTRMFFVPSPLPAEPTGPGCWVFTPTGCPNQQHWSSGFAWHLDTWGMAHRNAGGDKNACLSTRKKEFNSWCGSGDTQVRWNKPKDCVQTAWNCGYDCNKNTGKKKCINTITQKPTPGGKKCGPTEKYVNCLVHCEPTGWSAWGKCSKECGGGKKTRTRGRAITAKNGGKDCSPLSQTVDCHTQSCATNVSSDSHTDLESHKKGNDIRLWFVGPKLKEHGAKIVGKVQYHDQGWGNKKTDLFYCCDCTGLVQNSSNCVSLCGTDVRGKWKNCAFDKALPKSCDAGSSSCCAYRVGGGGGHEFHGRDFDGKIYYKVKNGEEQQTEAVTFEGLFVSHLEIAETSQANYFTGAAFGFVGVLLGIAGAVFYKRQHEAAGYEQLQDC